jgi:hypothetical protein
MPLRVRHRWRIGGAFDLGSASHPGMAANRLVSGE